MRSCHIQNGLLLISCHLSVQLTVFGPFAGLKVGGIWQSEIICHVDKSILTVTHLCMSPLSAVQIKKKIAALFMWLNLFCLFIQFFFTYFVMLKLTMTYYKQRWLLTKKKKLVHITKNLSPIKPFLVHIKTYPHFFRLLFISLYETGFVRSAWIIHRAFWDSKSN